MRYQSLCVNACAYVSYLLKRSITAWFWRLGNQYQHACRADVFRSFSLWLANAASLKKPHNLCSVPIPTIPVPTRTKNMLYVALSFGCHLAVIIILIALFLNTVPVGSVQPDLVYNMLTTCFLVLQEIFQTIIGF